MFIQMYREKYMRFPQGKCKALTFSYDDGVKADLQLIKILNEFGLKCTFNLNSELFDCECWHGRMNEEQTYAAFCNGPHEIALHGARHVFLNKVSLPEAIREIVLNREYLENKFGAIVNGMAYAYNSYNEEIIAFLKQFGIKYARTTQSTYSFEVPKDFLKLNPTCHHNDEKFLDLSDNFFNGSPENELKNREAWLFFVWGHSYEFDDGNNWDLIKNFARRAYDNRQNVWFATNGEICDYVSSFNSLIFSADGERVKNPSALDLWIELRGKVYKLPSGETILFDKQKL